MTFRKIHLSSKYFKKLNLLNIKAIDHFSYISVFRDLEHEAQKLREIFDRRLSVFTHLMPRFLPEGHTLMEILPVLEIGFHKIIINFGSDEVYINEKSKLTQEDWNKFKDLVLHHPV